MNTSFDALGDQPGAQPSAQTGAQSATQQPPLLELSGVTRTFGTGAKATHALSGVDLRITKGKSLGIVGESGAGKSTILKLLMGLDAPTMGAVRFRGELLGWSGRAQMREFRSEVQIVFQDPRSSLNPRMTVAQIITEPLRSLKIEGDHAARVAEVLDWVGLASTDQKKYPAQFSGGQRQRIAIARALAPSPQVLVADEPVSALDVSVRGQIMDLLAKLKQELGMTLVMVSHDMAIVGQLCEEVLVLKQGKVTEAGPTLKVFSDPQSAYTRQLLNAVPSLEG